MSTASLRGGEPEPEPELECEPEAEPDPDADAAGPERLEQRLRRARRRRAPALREIMLARARGRRTRSMRVVVVVMMMRASRRNTLVRLLRDAREVERRRLAHPAFPSPHTHTIYLRPARRARRRRQEGQRRLARRATHVLRTRRALRAADGRRLAREVGRHRADRAVVIGIAVAPTTRTIPLAPSTPSIIPPYSPRRPTAPPPIQAPRLDTALVASVSAESALDATDWRTLLCAECGLYAAPLAVATAPSAIDDAAPGDPPLCECCCCCSLCRRRCCRSCPWS